MKRLFMLLMVVFPMTMASHYAMAQEVTITLTPGWNWISYPNAVAMELGDALLDFTPMEGDIIKSSSSFSEYCLNQWLGGLTHFIPGKGYMYYSARSEMTEFVFVKSTVSGVVTVNPTDITNTGAVLGGFITLSESSHVFLRGVCWGTEPSPDIDGNHTSDSTGTGLFSSTLDSLSPNTTYYVRAYVVSDNGLSYGNEVSFTTLEDSGSSNVPKGAICGKFTINANGDQVYFSQGNLQYQASTNTWRFAENQWDFVGGNYNGSEYGNVYENGVKCNNHEISSTYSGWIDLFGWGTSGYNHGANCYQPWSVSTNYVDYFAYGSRYYNLSDQNGKADWGYNAICNGGNVENSGWKTLSKNQWDYLINSRNTNSGVRYAKSQINGVNGVVLLPDDWDVSIFSLENTNQSGAAYGSNVISGVAWEILEEFGAVFLPSVGFREGVRLFTYQVGSYWSATYGPEYAFDAYNLIISPAAIATAVTWRYEGASVRLVCDAE